MSDAKPRRRWFQFSLRTLLIAVAVVAGLAFSWLQTIEPYRLQREAMEAVARLGGTYKTEDAVGWVRYLDKNAQDVVVIDLADCDKPDEYLPHVGRLPRLRTLVVGGHEVGDEQIMALGRVKSLRGLVLDSTKVADEGIGRLKEKLPDLVAYKSERRACAELERLGADVKERWAGYVVVPTPRPKTLPPQWLQRDVGEAYCAEAAVDVVFRKVDLTDADLSWLGDLDELHALYVGRACVNGSFFDNMGPVSNLVSASSERLALVAFS